jgi:hypothetical protein
LERKEDELQVWKLKRQEYLPIRFIEHSSNEISKVFFKERGWEGGY